jgi:subtilisin family serine protease
VTEALLEVQSPAIPYSNGLGSTWGLKATTVARDASRRWTGRGILIAVLDSGADLAHPDLQARIVAARSFVRGCSPQDDLGHGTHCTGTAAGGTDVKGRRYGIACEASICVGRVLDETGRTEAANVIAGMDWAIALGCRVISMSIGTFHDEPSPEFESTARRALDAGCLVIASAGNASSRAVFQPANAASIMAVGAVDNWLRVARFSAGESTRVNGPDVDILAPGVQVYSTVPGSAYAFRDGTSMAAAHVAGIAALWAEAEGLRGRALWQRLCERAVRLPAPDVTARLVQAP